MTELHWQTITPEMRQVMTVFAQSVIGGRFYLAGGTALALQLGHRRSADLDYFTQTEDVPVLIEPLRNSLKSCEPELADSSWGNLVFLARGVRLGFYGYGYELLQQLAEVGETRMASVTEIALMKLYALLGVRIFTICTPSARPVLCVSCWILRPANIPMCGISRSRSSSA